MFPVNQWPQRNPKNKKKTKPKDSILDKNCYCPLGSLWWPHPHCRARPAASASWVARSTDMHHTFSSPLIFRSPVTYPRSCQGPQILTTQNIIGANNCWDDQNNQRGRGAKCLESSVWHHRPFQRCQNRERGFQKKPRKTELAQQRTQWFSNSRRSGSEF